MSDWDYGYPVDPRWRRGGQREPVITQYVEGSVVIDIIDPNRRELLWRGEGRAVLSDDVEENVKQLAKVAEAIVQKMPEAARRLAFGP